METKEKVIEFKITKDPKDAIKIFEISQKLLYTPKDYDESSAEKRKEYANAGFIIGNHSLPKIKTWMKNPKNHIYVGIEKTSDSPKSHIFGYAFVLGISEIVDEVQGYAENVQFEMSQAKEIINSRAFKYLIQIGIDPNYQNLGLGSKLFQYFSSNESVPLISFVIKSPLTNRPSLYTHIKNGFEYMGEYSGEYGNFEDYRSVGLIKLPSTSSISKDLAKKKMKQALL